MRLPRRRFLQLAAAAAVLPRRASALDYPVKPVRIVVGFAAGGPTDIAARLMGQWLSERLGHQFIVENRPGATGNIGAEAVVNAQPDGYTLLHIATNNAINTSLYEASLSASTSSATSAPVAGIMQVPNIMEVHPAVARPPRFRSSSSPMPGPIRAKSISPRAATARPSMSPANCSPC